MSIEQIVKLPVSAFIASHNEGHLLEDCLKSIQFCDEIVCVNLESNDNTNEVALKYKCKLVSHSKVEMIELLFPKFLEDLKNDWVLLIDPDEKIDLELQSDIKKLFLNISDDIGKINVPIQYYYKKRALKGTIWGGKKSGRLLIRKSHCIISDNVHTAIKLKDGYLTHRIEWKNGNVDHHYWVSSFKHMLDKHKRYVKNEGKSLFNLGERYSLINAIVKSIKAFKLCFITYKGYKDGLVGIFLSFFYTWYIWSSYNSLKKYQCQLK